MAEPMGKKRKGMHEGAGAGQALRPLVMACLSPSPSCRRVIRAAARMAFPGGPASPPGSGGPAPIALYVGSTGREADEDSRLRENILYARSMGFEVHTVQGGDIPIAISEYARREKVTDLFLGYSPPSFFLQARPAINEKLLTYLPTVDIHIIPDPVSSPYARVIRDKSAAMSDWNLRDFLLVLGIMAVATVLSAAFYVSRYSNANIITIYILGVLIASVMTSSRMYGAIAAVLYVLLFNFLFIEPRYTLLVYNSSYLVTYLVTGIAALITGTVAMRMKNVARASAENAYQAKILLDASRQLEEAADSGGVIRTTCMQIVHLLGRSVVFYPAGIDSPADAAGREADMGAAGEGRGQTDAGSPEDAALCFPARSKKALPPAGGRELEALRWSMDNSHQSGAYTSRYSDCACRYLSVFSGDHRYGVIGIDMEGRAFTEFENTILLSIVQEGTMALENKRIIQDQKRMEVLAENERLRAGLLRSISHDLRTPLTSIYGNAANLRLHEQEIGGEARRKIYGDIMEDADWLIAQFENILAMTRLESGIGIRKTVEDLEEVMEESIARARAHSSREILFRTEDGEGQGFFAGMDPRLMMQVVMNLLGNAIKYTPADTRIELFLAREQGRLLVRIADRGPGIPDADKPHIFELFYTGSRAPADSSRSMGIGLNLCAQILRAHGGGIRVDDNVPSGAVFTFWLPAADLDPQLPEE